MKKDEFTNLKISRWAKYRRRMKKKYEELLRQVTLPRDYMRE